MKRTWYSTVLFLLLVGGLYAQRPKPFFQTIVDLNQVSTDGYFELTYTLLNGEGENFQPPRFGSNLVVIAGPSRGVSTTIVNGKMSSEMSFTYTLQPIKPGKYSIPGASILVNGAQLRSNSVVVEAIAPSQQKNKSGKQDIFVKAILSSREAYIGQQIRLDYKLYTRVNVENFNVVKESDYAGFYAEDIIQPDLQVREESMGGVRYITRVLKTMALYPQQAGKLTIDPIVMQLGVVEGDPNAGSIFFGNETKRVPAQTEAITLVVKPLPANAPASFTGAVGNFTLGSTLNRTDVTTDDALSVTLVLTGDGDMKRVQAPKIIVPESFEVYEPTVKSEETEESQNLRVARKIFEYLVLPKKAGVFDIRPEFTYFDSNKKQYITIADFTYKVQVKQGANRPNAARKNATSGAEESLQPMEKLTGLHRARPAFWGSPSFLVLGFLPVLLLLGVVVVQNQLIRKKDLLAKAQVEKGGRKIALARLKTAAAHLAKGESRAFYDEVSKAILGYLSDRLQIPPGELSKEKIQQQLLAIPVQPELTERLLKTLTNCEMALFAGLAHPEAMQETYATATEILTELEEQKKRS
jgi:hypothetical protein